MLAQTNLNNTDAAKSIEKLIDEISEKFGGVFSNERITEVVFEIAADYQDATVSSFVPIFIQRFAHEKLSREIKTKDAS